MFELYFRDVREDRQSRDVVTTWTEFSSRATLHTRLLTHKNGCLLASYVFSSELGAHADITW